MTSRGRTASRLSLPIMPPVYLPAPSESKDAHLLLKTIKIIVDPFERGVVDRIYPFLLPVEKTSPRKVTPQNPVPIHHKVITDTTW